MTAPANPSSAPRFAIVRERDMPKRRLRRASPLAIGTLFGAIRRIIEDAYVSLAREVMVRAEHVEDARSGRTQARRAGKTERRTREIERAQGRAAPRSNRQR